MNEQRAEGVNERRNEKGYYHTNMKAGKEIYVERIN